MRLSILPSSLLLYVLLWATPTRCSSTADFSAYPSSVRSCLTQADNVSGCDGDTMVETNQCLCSDGGSFVTNAASCIGDQGADILTQVYDIMQNSCSATKTPLSISEADFLAASNSASIFTTVTSTVTTTSAGVATTFTTTSTSTETPAAASDYSSSDHDDDDDDDHGQITVSAKVGAISASVAGVLMIACVICVVVLLKKRKRDKALLQKVRDEARGHGNNGSRGGDKPLLDPGSMTPGLPSPTAGGTGGGREGPVFGANVTPPTPSYPGPTSPQVWRSGSQTLHNHGPTSSPSELSGEQWTYELYDSRSAGPHPANQIPSPVSQGIGTMGSWCPSPVSAMASSTALGPYGGGTSTIGTGTIGALSTLSQSSTRQITGTTRSSWAHDMPMQDEPYELPGTEVRSINPVPVEADSNPITRVPERLSLTISQAPPEYTPGGWIDPNTDKPPVGMI